MSHKVWLEAYDLKESGPVQYSENWIHEAVQDEQPEGRLILGYGSALDFIYKGIERSAVEIIITGDGDIFARPKQLELVLSYFWDDWHKNDPRWNWRWETIREFFEKYYAYGYVFVITVY